MNRFRERRRLKQQLESAPTIHVAAHPPASRLDKWLPRLGHFAQFGLLIVTVFTLFYTVIPLYQKAALEESIARKEMELRQAENAVEDAYTQVRSYAVRSYTFHVSTQCTSVDLPPGILFGTDDPNFYDARMLETDVQGCLKEQVKTSKDLKQLRASDFERLAKRVSQVAAVIETRRQAARADFYSVGLNFDKSPTKERDASLPQSAITGKKHRIVMEYADAARKHMQELNSLDWAGGIPAL